MSSENRKKVLLGFGALVVILVAAIALWPPNFRKEDASGAIGEVQKHRAPQIAKTDVVLGNESVKHQQKVLYADFIADAARLKSLGHADAAQLSQFTNELNVRYLAEITEALADAEAAARSTQNAKLQGEVVELQGYVRNHKQLEDSDMQQLNVKLAAIESQLDMRASRLKDADEQLGMVATRLASARLDNEYIDLAGKLKAVENELNAQNLFATTLADDVEYLQMVEMESRIVSARLSDQEMAQKLNVASDELMSRAMKNIEENVQLQEEMASRLQHMEEVAARASRTAMNQASMVNSAALLTRNLGAVSAALNRCDTEYRSRLNAAVENELAATRQFDSRLAQASELQHRLADFEQTLAQRQAH
jgi:hypothetical protein